MHVLLIYILTIVLLARAAFASGGQSMSESSSSIKVLVVCLGNICRSPMGAAVLKDVATKRGLDIVVDSAGTAGYHVGEEPDER